MALPINIEDLLNKRKILFLLLTALMVASCSNPNEKYVKKAVRIMDRNGIYAQGIEWEKAKEEALNAKPSSLEEAQEIVQKVGKVAGGKHTFLMTDEWTASSGEAVLICFRGLANSRTFGMPTAGYCSCNQIYTLPGGSQLALTIGEDIARTGEVFCDNPIEPDVTTETPLDDALEWIMHYKL